MPWQGPRAPILSNLSYTELSYICNNTCEYQDAVGHGIDPHVYFIIRVELDPVIRLLKSFILFFSSQQGVLELAESLGTVSSP